MTAKSAAAVLMTILICPPASGQPSESKPAWRLMGNADILMGQYFFEKQRGDINGYGDVELQLARSYSARSGLFLNYHGTYSGFKQVDELAGGGTLFQQSLDNAVSAKWIFRTEGGFSLKPRAALNNQLYRETADEKWGKGLYDCWRYEIGLAQEKRSRIGLSIPVKYQLSYDFYFTSFPMFKSLSSEFGAELSVPNPGSHIMDSLTHQFSLRADLDLPGALSAWGFYSFSWVKYPNQKVISPYGEYLKEKRSDAYHYLSLGAQKRLMDMQIIGRVRPCAGANLSVTRVFSSQNHFDADPRHFKYVEGYYNYWEAAIAPKISATFLKASMTVDLGYQFKTRFYTSRLTQTETGGYKNKKLIQNSNTAFLELDYPVMGNISAKFRGSLAFSGANTDYEQTYRYNYKNSNYFLGIGWKL